jgi:hypothetical protein
MSNVKNYTEQGGERSVINGELLVGESGLLKLRGARLSAAAGIPDSTAATVTALKDEFNALLKKLQSAGLMERAVILAQADAQTDNKINTVTSYLNVSDDTDDWVTDAIIETSTPIPAGAVVTINNPAIGGDGVVLPSATDRLWLSDVIKSQNAAVPTRTKLNLHTSQAFDFTLSGLTEDLTADLRFIAVTANAPELSGTHQSEKEITDYVILTTSVLSGATFIADA